MSLRGAKRRGNLLGEFVTGLDEIKVLLGQALASNGPPDRCIGWVRVRPSTCKKADTLRVSAFLVPVTGLEPVRCRQRWILRASVYSVSSGM